MALTVLYCSFSQLKKQDLTDNAALSAETELALIPYSKDQDLHISETGIRSPYPSSQLLLIYKFLLFTFLFVILPRIRTENNYIFIISFKPKRTNVLFGCLHVQFHTPSRTNIIDGVRSCYIQPRWRYLWEKSTVFSIVHSF